MSEPLFRPEPKDVALYMRFRKQAGHEMERFINEHIDRRESFAFETTLRDVTFEQARRATRNGFRVVMIFVAGGDAEEHVERVAERGSRGGHVASEGALVEIYHRGMAMLRRAFEENRQKHIEVIEVHHNPRVPAGSLPNPELLVEMTWGVPARSTLAPIFPPWFEDAMRDSDFSVEMLRKLA